MVWLASEFPVWQNTNTRSVTDTLARSISLPRVDNFERRVSSVFGDTLAKQMQVCDTIFFIAFRTILDVTECC